MQLLTDNDYRALVEGPHWERIKAIAALPTDEQRRVAERAFNRDLADRQLLSELQAKAHLRNIAQVQLENLLAGITSIKEIEERGK